MANRIEDDSMALEVDGKALVERNRFIQLTGGTTSVNRELETKTHALARIKGYHPTCGHARMALRSPRTS